MGNIICWWKGHHYDTAKYSLDLKKFHFAHRDLLFRTKEEIENYYNNPPLPFCFRCKKDIPFMTEQLK